MKKYKQKLLRNIKTLLRKNDKVLVTAGKEKGKTGKILRVYPKTHRLLISGLNLQKRNIKPNRDMPQGGVLDKESPICISDVMLFCNKCNKAVRVGVKRLPDKSRMRQCNKCGLEI